MAGVGGASHVRQNVERSDCAIMPMPPSPCLMSISTFVTLPLMRNCNLLRLPKRQLECWEAIALLRLFFDSPMGAWRGGCGAVARSPISCMSNTHPHTTTHRYTEQKRKAMKSTTLANTTHNKNNDFGTIRA